MTFKSINPMKNILLFICCLSLLLSSCSLVKNPHSTNFARVKYNSHVKLAKSEKRVLPKTIESFELNDTKIAEVKTEEASVKLEREQDEISPKEELATLEFPKKKMRTLEVKQLLNEVKKLDIKKSKKQLRAIKANQSRDWWDDDIEDWPWLDICLALIAILLIAIIVTLLVDLIGGIISGLIGLILLIALAYLLYTLWIR